MTPELRASRGGQPPADSVLCYVADPWAFFTTDSLDKVYGDDWDDAPYEHNAGDPYQEFPTWIVAVETVLAPPHMSHLNSPWSVEQINAGEVPWLRPEFDWEPPVRIYAGCTFTAFVELIGSAGGRVFVPIEEKAA